jgi:hypothetical protein
MAKHWMQSVSKAIKKRGTEGSFSRAAARAGKSTQEFAHEHDKGNSKTAKRARLAEAFAKARR